MGKMIEYNEDNYRDFEHYSGIAVIRFYAHWCTPCVQNMPLFEQLAAQCDNAIKFGRVNVDQSPILTLRYNVFGLPSTLIFQNSVIVERIAGIRPASYYLQLINSL